MLQYLKIKNLALIENAELDLDSGFTAITGETGAGKSILLGALMLLSGARADKTHIKKNANCCEVEAALHFEDSKRIDECLQELGLPLCEDGTLILKRSIYKNKAARIYVNNALGTQTALREIGTLWIDFHGPGEHQRLFKEKYQLEILDLYSRNNTLLSDYQSLFKAWRNVLSEIREISSAEKLSEDDIYFLNSQIDSIDDINPSAEGIDKLERDFQRVSNAKEIINCINNIETALSSEGGAMEKLSDATKYAHELAEIDSSGRVLSDRIDAVIIDLEDVVQEYATLSDPGDLSEETINDLHERMNKWLEIKRRYGPDVESVITKREALSYKLSSQADIEGVLKKLESKAKVLEGDLCKLADKLHKQRIRGGNALCKKVSTLLKALGFQKANITVEFLGDGKLHDYGKQRCILNFQPNPGEDSLPLSKIASSGEIARVMLAIKTVLAELDQTPVLVFDEVDANVGGEVGARVGKELASLGGKHQVLCVTHLPQVAAQAENHYLICKVQGKEKTDVIISSLHQNDEQRLAEVSRMLGDSTSASAIKHAEELLSKRLI